MFGRLSAALVSILERFSPRERVLLGVLGLVAVGMICVLAVLLTHRSLGRLEREVAAHSQALRDLRAKAPELRTRLEASKGASDSTDVECPALGTQLEAHASKAGLGDAALEMVDQPEEIVGRWVRKSVQIRLRKQPLGKLADFWSRTVNDRARFPVAITKLNVRRRRHEEDSYDIDMITSCYSPADEPPPTKTKTRGRASKTKSGRSKG